MASITKPRTTGIIHKDNSLYEYLESYSTKGAVQPEQFGADNKGVTYSTEALRSTFIFAKEQGMKVVGSGVYLIDGSIETYGVPFDFSAATLKLDGAKMGGGAKTLLITDEETQIIPNFDLGGMVKGQSGTLSLATYDGCSVGIDSTEPAYLRAITPSYTLDKKDILVINKNVHRLTPAFYDITSLVTLTVRPLRQEIHCKLPKFVLHTAPSGRFGPLVYVARNNVKLSGGYVDSDTMSVDLSRNMLEAFIRAEKCAFLTVLDVHSKMSPLDSGYQVVVDQVHGLTMERCTDQTGWRLQDGNYFRNTIIRDCQGRGIGGHAMTYNYSVENFTNCYNGIHLTGGGYLSIKNIRNVDYGGNLKDGGIVKIREDYGASWDGDIEIDGVDILVQPVTGSSTALSVLLMWASYTGTQDYTQESVQWGKSVTVKNVHITNRTSNRINLTPVEWKTSLAQNVTPPSQINVDTVTMSGVGDVRVLPLGFDLYSDAKVAQVTTIMNVSNIDNKLGTVDIAQSIADGTKPNIRNAIVRNISNYRGLGLTLSVPGKCYTYVKDSVVNFINGAAKDDGKHYFYNCRMTGTEFSTNQGFNHFYNCHFDTAKADFKVGTRVTIGCHINSGAAITGGGGGVTSAAALWSYKDSTYA